MTTKEGPIASGGGLPLWAAWLIPLVLLAGLIALFVNTNPLRVTNADLPPVEDLSFQRINVTANGVEVQIRNAGQDPITVAQVLVDEAYWTYTIWPDFTLKRLQTATININYPWVETEPHEIVIITSSGTTFASEVALAIETPTPGLNEFLAYGLVGVYVGIVPVALGLLWFPALRRLGRKGLGFVLALTVGLLVFLLVDTLLEAFELGAALPGVFQGVPLALFAAVLTWLAIVAIGSRQSVADRSSPPGRAFVALLISTCIGFHNLG